MEIIPAIYARSNGFGAHFIAAFAARAKWSASWGRPEMLDSAQMVGYNGLVDHSGGTVVYSL
jgi:hypothetical protein